MARFRRTTAGLLSAALLFSAAAPAAAQGGPPAHAKNGGPPAHAQAGGPPDHAQGPKREVEGLEWIDASTFIIDFDKTAPPGLPLERYADISFQLDGDAPEVVNRTYDSDDKSLVTVHLSGELTTEGTLIINGYEAPFDFAEEEEDTGPSILDVRQEAIGTDQTVSGIVTAAEEAGGQTNMYIQDDSAAILVRGAGLGDQYDRGDLVEFEGELNQFRDMLQILVDDSEMLEEDAGEIEPELVDATFFDGGQDDIEAKLITVEDLTLTYDDFNDYDAETPAGAMRVLGSLVDLEETTYDEMTGVVNYHFYENKLMPRDELDVVKDATLTRPAQASEPSGTIPSGTEVTLSSPSEDAVIYYTLDGSDPTIGSAVYDGPITITEETTLKTMAVADGLSESEVLTYTYGIALEAGEATIADIQGEGHVSPYEGQTVRDVPGIVTHTENNAFYMQMAESDGNLNTSEGMFVYLSGHDVEVGDEVHVDGTVAEWEQDGYDDNDDLRTTQISGSNADVISSGNELPAPIVIGVDREIPEELIANIDEYDIETGEGFNAETNAIDFYESLENMRIEIPGQVTVTGPQKYQELTVVSEEWDLENRTPTGGVYLEENPEAGPELNTEIMFVNVPYGTVAKTGDYFDEGVTGVMSYNFGNFKVEPTEELPELMDGGNERRDETTIEFNEDELTVATYNVENYDQSQTEKTQKLAASMADELNAPDIMTLVEVMDNSGESDDGVTSADENYEALAEAIADLGGPNYAYTESAPIDGLDGGIPGGNIRVGHMYRTDRVELPDTSVAPSGEGVTIEADGSLSHGTGFIDPQNDAFQSSRKPVVTEFSFKGEPVYVIGNHWNSKRGDLAAYGMEQPALQGSRDQRQAIAEVVGGFVADLNEANEQPNVVALGDFNDFPWSEPVETLADLGGMYNTIFELPRNEQYTYNYNGNSQSLDSILISEHLQDGLDVDFMNINSEFMEVHGRASDHDPAMVQLVIPDIDPDYDMGDVTAPEITFEDDALNSDPTVTINQGDDFTAPAVTAEDNVDGDLTDQVTVSGDDFDTNKSGTYTVRYEVTDSSGNTAVKNLTVEVLFEGTDIAELENAGFEAWTDGLPDNWFGGATNIAQSRTIQSSDAFDGEYAAQLVNESTSHNRFTTQRYSIEEGATYEVTFQAKGNGEIRNAMFAEGLHGNNYSGYSAYTTLTGGDWTEITWEYEAPGSTEAELIISLRNTDADGILVDNVEITKTSN
ncbi:chitobiase/beta-hexosaminidase C-terminal domain-containing protein [Alkalicoccus urumqiensis]|uniref:chitobiase/beta-hexosaminidase C-terminal domain-containing protein n=1 Tax=Alkalicoccus urumqiensis TaxID=1548213 RepID=UPI0015E59CD0|nr:chitobiase/beta-hexosaminidase C-terminal domain-containing protein [Alkalicoccus urumqiensis]